LVKLVDQEFNKSTELKTSTQEKWARILSREQAQELLDKVVEFHKGTGRVHGDLAHFDDVIVDSYGKIRLTDPEWERIGEQTPSQELASLYEFFTKFAGYKDLVLPETISDEESRKNLDNFEREVVEKVEINPLIGSSILKFKDQEVDIKIGDDGTVLVKKKNKNSEDKVN
jgi:hypothetical protein